MKFKVNFLILLFNIFVITSFAGIGESAVVDRVPETFELRLENDLNVNLEYPDIHRIIELSSSFEADSINVGRTKRVAYCLLAAGVLAAGSRCAYNYLSDNKVNKPKSDDSSSSADDKKSENTTGDAGVESKLGDLDDKVKQANIDYLNRKGDVSHLVKKNIGNGVSLVLAGSIVGVILGTFSMVTDFSKEQIFSFLEKGSLQNTFLILKEALVFNLNWTAELLEDLSTSQLQTAGNFTSYSGLIDNNFTWVHALENFLAIALAKTKISFGQNSFQYRKIVSDQKILLNNTRDFVDSLECDINVWNTQGYCNVSNDTLKLLRILTSQLLKFSQTTQLMLYKSSVRSIIPSK